MSGALYEADDNSPTSETTSLLGSGGVARKQPAAHDSASLNSRPESYTQIPRYRPSSAEIDDNDLEGNEFRDNERRPLLDPSDPAVSPLNLKGVRFMKLALSAMLIFTYVLAIVLFINCFVSLPFIKLRTSGFLELE